MRFNKTQDLLHKLILQKCPDYDFERYHFVSGDIVELNDSAIIVVKNSALDYVTAFVSRRSFKYHEYGEVRVPYSDLPYYHAGEFQSMPIEPVKRVRWQVGDIVTDPTWGTTGYLFEEVGFQRFHMYVLESDNNYYLHTGIYLENPWAGYVIAQG